jgi:hypothetical protein
MNFSFFKPPIERYLLKSREYLEDVKLKRVEHEAAAERHRAMTELYAQRIGRIESEISQALQAASSAPPPDLPADGDSVLAASGSLRVYATRASRASIVPGSHGWSRKKTRNARSFRWMPGIQPERRSSGPKLAIARLLPHDSGQLPGAGRHKENKVFKGGALRRRPCPAYSASIPAALTMRPHFCDSPVWNLSSSWDDVVNTSVPVGL